MHRVLSGAASQSTARPASCMHNTRRRGEHTASPAAAAAAAEAEPLLTSWSRWRRSRPAVGEGGVGDMSSAKSVAGFRGAQWSHQPRGTHVLVGQAASLLNPRLHPVAEEAPPAMQPARAPPARSAPRGGPPCARAPPCSWRAAPPAGPQCSAGRVGRQAGRQVSGIERRAATQLRRNVPGRSTAGSGTQCVTGRLGRQPMGA